MFKKIMLIILSACELFLCYLAFFKKDGSSGGTEQAAYGKELAERYMTDKEKTLYRQVLERVRAISAGEAEMYSDGWELSDTFSEDEGKTAGYKIQYFAEKYAPEYTFWLQHLLLYVFDGYAYLSFNLPYEYISAEYRIPAEQVAAANKALENAKAIAAKYDGKSDYDKVIGYATEICELVEYDHKAADNDEMFDETVAPWRIVNVFDGDPDTNAVCEGYASAFSYLCGLGGVECHRVNGYLKDASGTGYHTWNIVVINGKSYFVDVTGCDLGYSAGEIKRLHPFIMNSVTKSTPEGLEAQNITKSSAYYSLSYTYDDYAMEYLPDDLRTVTEKPYRGKRMLYILMGAVLVCIVLCVLPKRKSKNGVSDNYGEQWNYSNPQK